MNAMTIGSRLRLPKCRRNLGQIEFGATQLSNEPGPKRAYGARTNGPPHRPRIGIPVPSARQETSRKPGHCVPTPSEGRVRPRLLLAQAQLSPRTERSEDEHGLLEGEKGEKQRSGSTSTTEPPPTGMERDGGLGMPMPRHRQTDRRDCEIPGRMRGRITSAWPSPVQFLRGCQGSPCGSKSRLRHHLRSEGDSGCFRSPLCHWKKPRGEVYAVWPCPP